MTTKTTTKAKKGAASKAAPTTSTKKKAAKRKTKADVAEHRLVHAEIVEPREEDTEEFRPVEGDEVYDKPEVYEKSDESDLDKIDLDEAVARLPVLVPQDTDTTSASSGGSSLVPADPVTTYLAEIRRYPLLTKEQEHELAVRYRESGDPRAAERLVTANLRFVVKIAAEYSKFGAKLIDLIQEGNVGLMHAVREFNPYKGVRLITYAVWWIRGYIQEYLMRQYSMVRIGTTQAQRKLFYRLQKEKELLDAMGQEVTIPLLSSRLGVSEEEVASMTLRLSGRDLSLNQPLDAESSASLLDMETSDEPGVDETLGKAEELDVLRRNIEAIRPRLSEKELYILDRRILADEPLTLQDIGEHYGVTREAVRQLEARLINRIRTAYNESVEVHPDAAGGSASETDAADDED